MMEEVGTVGGPDPLGLSGLVLLLVVELEKGEESREVIR